MSKYKISKSFLKNDIYDSSNIQNKIIPTCLICFDEINHETNIVKCKVCKDGVYHRECLGYWFYKKDIERNNKRFNKKYNDHCTLCKNVWKKKESNMLKSAYIKAHFLLRHRRHNQSNIKSVSDVYNERLKYFNNFPPGQNMSRNRFLRYFKCFTKRRSNKINPSV